MWIVYILKLSFRLLVTYEFEFLFLFLWLLHNAGGRTPSTMEAAISTWCQRIPTNPGRTFPPHKGLYPPPSQWEREVRCKPAASSLLLSPNSTWVFSSSGFDTSQSKAGLTWCTYGLAGMVLCGGLFHLPNFKDKEENEVTRRVGGKTARWKLDSEELCPRKEPADPVQGSVVEWGMLEHYPVCVKGKIIENLVNATPYNSF